MSEVCHSVGIDVSKSKLDIALLISGKINSKVFDNTPQGYAQLHEWLCARSAIAACTHICREATGPYSEAVALALLELGFMVNVVNPARIKGFAQSEWARNKTDRADATLLARFCAAMRPQAWTPPSKVYRELRAWVDRLQALKDIRQRQHHRRQSTGLWGRGAAFGQCQSLGGIHWRYTATAFIGHLGQRAHDDEPVRSSGLAYCALYAGISRTTA